MKIDRRAIGMLGVGALMISAAAWLAMPATAAAGAKDDKLIEQAETQLTIALKLAEQSLAPHKVGSGWTRMHMQQVINVLQGEQGPDFKAKVENPGDGHGAVTYLKAAQDALANDQISPEVKEALSHTMAYLEEATEHAKRSIKGANVAEVHGHARLAVGMLMAALGSAESTSPVTGGLRYVRSALVKTSMPAK
ncbi:MAG: hypothetical protein AB1555_15625 [Nitrospirota bacterium]